MKIVNLVQGTPEWHAHRAKHRNASDAPAMLGLSPYKSRAALLREIATGIGEEITPDKQRLFDDGHAAEAKARPLAEAIIREELFPCTGVLEDTALSASFDGLTMEGDIAFEHKALNDRLREAMGEGCTGADLPMDYQVQMEQQAMVSGAKSVLFMASKWNGEKLVEERHCVYTPSPSVRAMLVQGWAQFEADLAAFQVEPVAAPAPVGRVLPTLPALRVEVTGMVTASNLAEYRDQAIAVFRGINTDLQTDQDFADAELAAKWCEDIEGRLKAAKDHALSQTESIDQLFRALDQIGAEARAKRLEITKLVGNRKEAIRQEIAVEAWRTVQAHYDAINTTMGEHALRSPMGDTQRIGAAMKGKRTVATLREAANNEANLLKIEASQQAERVRACVAFLAEVGSPELFPDRVALCASKTPDDLRNLALARLAEKAQREHDRREQERQEQNRLEAQAAIRAETSPPVQANHAPQQQPVGAKAATTPVVGAATRKIKLGDINAAIAPLTITADGLASLGFQPVGNAGAAKLYDANVFDTAIRRALLERIAGATVSTAREAA
jgi:putative phage-type endonuclease